MNCKCEATDLPAMQTPRRIIAPLGICADSTNKVLLHDEYPFPENVHLVRIVSKPCIRTNICRPEGFIAILFSRGNLCLHFKPQMELIALYPTGNSA